MKQYIYRSIAKLKEDPIKYKEFREKDIKYRKELKEKKEQHSKRVLEYAGSHVYEINTWQWNFGRPQPRVQVGGLSVVKTEEIRRRSRSETCRRAWKTRQAPKRAADEEESS